MTFGYSNFYYGYKSNMTGLQSKNKDSKLDAFPTNTDETLRTNCGIKSTTKERTTISPQNAGIHNLYSNSNLGNYYKERTHHAGRKY